MVGIECLSLAIEWRVSQKTVLLREGESRSGEDEGT